MEGKRGKRSMTDGQERGKKERREEKRIYEKVENQLKENWTEGNEGNGRGEEEEGKGKGCVCWGGGGAGKTSEVLRNFMKSAMEEDEEEEEEKEEEEEHK